MKKMLLGTAALIALATPAMAQDKSGTTYTPQPTTSAAPTPVYHAAPAESAPTSISSDSGTNPLSGAYVGVYGGYGWDHVKTPAGKAKANGLDYGVFAGYKLDRLLENSMGGLSAAVEAFYGGSNANDTVAGTKVEKNGEWGLSFRPGLSIANGFNPYGILGYRRASYDVAGAGHRYNGFDLGIGSELMAWDNVGLRAEYTHTFYHKNNGIDPSENAIRLGLSYHFY